MTEAALQAALRALPFIVAALVAATAVSFVLTPFAFRFARRIGAIDQPDAGRRVHRLPIPRAGGLAVVASFVGVGVAALVVNDVLKAVPPLRQPPLALAALFGGVVLAACLGFIDDRFGIRARWQLVFQLLLAAVAVSAGIVIRQVDNPLGFLGGLLGVDPVVLAGEAVVLVSILWIVGMINSINFIDGLDGLSTGVSLVAALTLALLSVTRPDQILVALLCAVLAGSLAGFLPWNFHPARVFIGTTGVYAVGYALAVLSILGVAKVAVALLVLGVPIIDTFWIIIRRLAAGQSPFTPDRGHFHHRLLDLGLTHRGAVLVIYGISTVLAVLSLVLSGAGPLYAFAGIVVGGGLVLYLMTRRSQDALDARSYAPEADPGGGPET